MLWRKNLDSNYKTLDPKIRAYTCIFSFRQRIVFAPPKRPIWRLSNPRKAKYSNPLLYIDSIDSSIIISGFKVEKRKNNKVVN